MAIITPALVSALFTGFRAEFQRVYGETPSHWDKVATLMPSTSKSNTYGWLGQFPQLVEWVGPRVLKDMAAHGYSITNKLFESTVGVKRTDIEDDEVGIYKPLFGEMGRAAKSFPDELVYGLLRLGLSTLCFDGQYFFDTDHPVYPNVDGTGAAATIANIADGTDIPWFLLDTSRVLKPVLFQERTKPELTSMTRADDEAVFMTDEYPPMLGDLKDQRSFVMWASLWLGECWRLARAGASCLVFSDWRQLPALTDAIQAAGWAWKGIIVWHKPNARPSLGSFRHDAEFVIHGVKDRMQTHSRQCLPGVFTYAVDPRQKVHLTAKPVRLVKDLLAVSPEGATVLDPFLGGGTTAMACLETGRRFIGVELSTEYAALAAARIRAAEEALKH